MRPFRLVGALLVLVACGEGPSLVVTWDPGPVEQRLPGVIKALRLMDPAGALTELDRLEDAGQLPEGSLHFRALALGDLGRTGEAIGAWEAELEEHPGNGRAHALLARLRIDAGNLDSAEKHLVEARRHAPDFPLVLLLTGRMAMLRNDDERAARAFRDYLLVDPFGPQAAEAHHALSQIAARRGSDGAEEARRQEQLSRDLQTLHNYKAKFEAALRDDPEDTDAAFGISATYLSLYLNRGADARLLAEAEGALRYVLERKPDHARAIFNLGFVRTEQRRFEEAETLFRSAITTEPEYAAARINLGKLLANQGRRDEALAEFGQALGVATATEDVARIHYELAQLLEQSEDEADLRQALTHYETLLELFPDDEIGVQQRLDALRARLEAPAPEDGGDADG